MIKKLYVKYKAKKLASDTEKKVKKEFNNLKRATRNFSKSLSATKIPIKIRAR